MGLVCLDDVMCVSVDVAGVFTKVVRRGIVIGISNFVYVGAPGETAIASG